MDLQIRGETKNKKSLDDAMRLLYERFSGTAGFQSEDVVTTIRDATGVDLHAFFLKHVSAAREIEWAEVLPLHGLPRRGGAAAADRDQLRGRAGRRRRRDREGRRRIRRCSGWDSATTTS